MPSMVRIHHPPRGLRLTEASVAGVAQLVERQPSKLNVAGSNPVSRSNDFEAGRRSEEAKNRSKNEEKTTAAHSKSHHRPPSSAVEHFLGKEEVTGSSPVVGS